MIIVFGSNVLDLFFHQSDLPPKDTAKFIDSHEEAAGGKGANQAVAAVRAGSEVRFFGALGKGGHGRQMYDNLAKCGLDVSGIQFHDCPSGLATIFVDDADGTHKIVVSHGANLRAKQDTIPDNLLTNDTIVLVQGELPIEETQALLNRAKKNGARCIMNFAPATQNLTEQALHDLYAIILNEHEANLLGKSLGMDTQDKRAFAEALCKKYNLITLVTLGGIGSIVASQKGLWIVPPLPIKPIDTVGAGDAYTGYFCAALDQGKDFDTALRWASVAGSVACTKVGAQTALPFIDEVRDHVSQIKVSKLSSDDSADEVQPAVEPALQLRR